MNGARLHAAFLLPLFSALLSLDAGDAGGAGDGPQASFPEYGLTISLPELTEFAELEVKGEQVERTWTGKLGAADVRIDFVVLKAESFGVSEPGGVTGAIVSYLRSSGDFDVERSAQIDGPFGHAAFASLVEGALVANGQVVGSQLVLGGLLKDAGYALHVRCEHASGDPARETLRAFLEKGIAYEGPERDPAWTMDEVRARWVRDVPEDLHGDFLRNLGKKNWIKNSITRTEHYLILTNSDGGKKFGQAMEKNYEEIQSIFPFEEAKKQRLMPVFLFRTDEDYFRFYARIAEVSLDDARRSGGHAWRDYYASWYEAPGDAVHLHEQVHQIFSNRLYLQGGGSWFQEGVAEYVESPPNQRGIVASQIAKGRGIPLEQFVQMESLLYSSEEERKTGGSAAGDAYMQGALFIEFLREGKWADRFEEFLRTLGHVPSGDIDKIRAGFQRVYGVGLDEIDREFQKHCKQR